MIRAIVIIFCLSALPWPSLAQSNNDARCEWTECTKEEPFKTEFSQPQFEPTPAAKLYPCEKDDELACAEECRSKFDNEFHKCKRDCLNNHCIRKSTEITSDTRLERSGCVELASPDCQEQCQAQPENQDSKASNSIAAQQCRRQCLSQKCPNANPLDIANEGREPGDLRCTRCKSDHKITCQRDCMLGTMSFPHPGVALEQLACEKLCSVATCEEECGLKLGF